MLQTEHHINVNKLDMTEVFLWCGQVVVAETGVIIELNRVDMPEVFLWCGQVVVAETGVIIELQ